MLHWLQARRPVQYKTAPLAGIFVTGAAWCVSIQPSSLAWPCAAAAAGSSAIAVFLLSAMTLRQLSGASVTARLSSKP